VPHARDGSFSERRVYFRRQPFTRRLTNNTLVNPDDLMRKFSPQSIQSFPNIGDVVDMLLDRSEAKTHRPDCCMCAAGILPAAHQIESCRYGCAIGHLVVRTETLCRSSLLGKILLHFFPCGHDSFLKRAATEDKSVRQLGSPPVSGIGYAATINRNPPIWAWVDASPINLVELALET